MFGNRNGALVWQQLVLLTMGTAVWGQTAPPQATPPPEAPSSVPASVRHWTTDLKFEVVSVKPSDPNGGRGRSNVSLTDGDTYVPTGGVLRATGQSLERYIAFAYDLDPNPDPQLEKLPEWANTTRYDIEAHAGRPVTKDEMRSMMRSLLKERFKLEVSYELRNMPVYTLTVVKPGQFGPQMREHQDEPGHDCNEVATAPAPPTPPPASPSPGPGTAPATAASAGGRGRGPRATPDGYPEACGERVNLPPSQPGRVILAGRNTTMDIMVNHINGGIDHPVVDMTGLKGHYDWWFEYSPAPASDGPLGINFQRDHPDDNGPNLFEALPKEIGLKLNLTKMEVQFLTFDHLERPTPN